MESDPLSLKLFAGSAIANIYLQDNRGYSGGQARLDLSHPFFFLNIILTSFFDLVVIRTKGNDDCGVDLISYEILLDLRIFSTSSLKSNLVFVAISLIPNQVIF